MARLDSLGCRGDGRLRDHDEGAGRVDSTSLLQPLAPQQLWRAQKDACFDVWEKISQLAKLGG